MIGILAISVMLTALAAIAVVIAIGRLDKPKKQEPQK